MSNYSLGLSGIRAAQRGLDLIGNNVANAATQGYHRQQMELRPAYSSQYGDVLLGGGVELGKVSRSIDALLEQEIIRQDSLLEHVRQELTTLQTIENAFGELTTENSGLDAAIDSFFNALNDLSIHPGEVVYQNQLITSAQNMLLGFRSVGVFLDDLSAQLVTQAQYSVEQVNVIVDDIARLNTDIERMVMHGSEPNNLFDQRDKLISDLSKIIPVKTFTLKDGRVDVIGANMSLVTRNRSTHIRLGATDTGRFGIAADGDFSYSDDFEGGSLGGILSLKNNIIGQLSQNLDSLALAITGRINQWHSQGVGSTGPFSQLEGIALKTSDLSQLSPAITDGEFYIRLTDTQTGIVSRHKITVDITGGDTVEDIVQKISAINGLSADFTDARLRIFADSGYKFDFCPAVLPTAEDRTGSGPSAAQIDVSGIYTGSENIVYEFRVSDAGDVGNDTVKIDVTVKNTAGETLRTLTIDAGANYVAGTNIDIDALGLKISFNSGSLAQDETWKISAFASTDSSGLLVAAGMNTFFRGSSARDMSIADEIIQIPGRVAASIGPDMNDNLNASRMAALKDAVIAELSNMTCGDYYRRLAADVGQQVQMRQIRTEGIEGIVKNLYNQQGDISGVNINEEAAKMLIYEQMFQIMAKYLTTMNESMNYILNVI